MKTNLLLRHLQPRQPFKCNFEFVVYLFFLGIPFVDVFTGALTSSTGGSSLSVIYKSLVISLFFKAFLNTGFRASYALFIFTFVSLIFIGALLHSVNGESNLQSDLIFMARGPVLMGVMLLLLLSIKASSCILILIGYSKITWLTICLSIILLNLLGISQATYDAGFGSKGVYNAANEITFIFVLAWWVITNCANMSFRTIMFYTVATIFTLYMIGTKSGFVMLFIFAFWHLSIKYKLSSSFTLILFVAVCSVVISAAGHIFLAIVQYLPGAEIFTFYIENQGATSALTGGRFVMLDLILNIYSKFSFVDFLLGIGFQNFWDLLIGNSVESDLFDLIGGGGLVFTIFFYGSLIWGYAMSRQYIQGRYNDSIWAPVFISAILYSIFVGHVAFAATPVVSITLILAMVIAKRNYLNDRNNTLEMK